MVRKYIESAESIIVNVLNCTNEAANAESLKLSKEVDPKRARTLLVLTKVDQFTDSGLAQRFNTMITKEGFPPNRVFLVRNRTQKENDDGISLNEVQRREMEYFRDRDDLNGVPDSSKGSAHLTEMLVSIQREKLMEVIPKLRRQIDSKIRELETERKQFANIPLTKSECRRALWEILRHLFERLTALIRAESGVCGSGMEEDMAGHDDSKSDVLVDAEEKQYVCSKTWDFFQKFKDTMSRFVDFDSNSLIKKMESKMKMIRNFNGDLGDIFHPSIIVMMHRDQVQQTMDPAVNLVDETQAYLDGVVEEEVNRVTEQFPQLRQVLWNTMSDVLRENHRRTKDVVVDIVNVELSKPFTVIAHDEKEAQGIAKAAIQLCTLWVVVRDRMCDYIPMQITDKMMLALISRDGECRVHEAMNLIFDDGWKALMSVDKKTLRKMERNQSLLAEMMAAKAKLSKINWL